MVRYIGIRLCAVVALLLACPSVWAGWTFDGNTPDSGNSITQYQNTVGNGTASMVGATARYGFQQDWNGEWKTRNANDVTGVAGPMGMVFWSQTLSPLANAPDASNPNAWPISGELPLPMPGFKKDYRDRLMSANDDIMKLNITVTQ